MKRIISLLVLLNVLLLVGCNKRNKVEALPTLDGDYQLVNFISSNLNNYKEPFKPFSVFDVNRLEIEGSTLTTVEVTSGNNYVYKSTYEIVTVEENSFKVANSNNYVLQNTYYYDLKLGVIEFVIDVLGEIRHYIYSKSESFTNQKIEGETYELFYAAGTFDGQLISIDDWTFFEYKVARDKISIYFQEKGKSKTYGHGYYEHSIIGVKVIYDDFEEYLTYDAQQKTLTLTQRITATYNTIDTNITLVFKMKS